MTENTLKIESASITDKGLSEKRPQNEDSYLEMRERGLFVVADGVGGAQAGEVASQMAVEQLGEAFNNLKAGGDAEDLMRVAIERANKSIYQMSQDLSELATMATTVVALHIAGNIATIGHVGDSRLYRLDSNNQLHRETQDHSVVEEEVRAGRMTEAQAANHPSRNIISRALGADFAVDVDMKTIMFEPNTTFLLCSDGITRHISDTEIRELLSSNNSLQAVVEQMKKICYERGAEDNLTAVIAKINAAGAPTETFAPTKIAAVHDYEEPTVATARSSSVSSASSSANAETAPLDARATKNLSQTNPPPNDAQTRETISNSTVVRSQTVPLVAETDAPAEIARQENVPAPARQQIQTETRAAVSETATRTIETDVETRHVVETPRAVETVEQGSGSKLGKILSALLWLIVGGLLGAGLYYLFERNNPPAAPAPVLVQQSDDINLTSFETNRRNVDRNPQQFLAANATTPPEDAEDFYLLGRANLLTGKFPEAKQMLTQARERLAQSSEENKKVLANDIETGLLIVEVPFAQDEFEKRLNLNQPNANTPQTNTNANQTTENR